MTHNPMQNLEARPAVLLTRPRAGSDAFARQMLEAGLNARVYMSPVLDIVGRKPALNPRDYDVIIVTSQNALLSYDADLSGRLCFAVGIKTAELAKARGMRVISANGDADALVSLVKRQAPKQTMIHLRGTQTRGDVCQRLKSAGFAVDEAVCYDQVAIPLSDEAKSLVVREKPTILPLFSPRSAALVRDELPKTANIRVICMSVSVAEAFSYGGLKVSKIAEAPHASAMITALREVMA